MHNHTPPYTITSKILAQVSNIVELLTELKSIDKAFNAPKLRKKNRVKSITGTLQIEGNSFTEEKVTSVINGTQVLGTVRELSEVQGAIKAYDYFDSYDYKKEKDLLHSHELLMDALLTNAGTYRHTNVGIGGKEGVAHPPNQVPSLMGDLFAWLRNTDEHLLVVSCVFHYEFEFIHPFSDGNGRVGRLWQSVILNQYKNIFGFIPIESVVRENQEKYYRSLEDAGSAGESRLFIEFMLEVVYNTLQVLAKESINVPLKRLEEIVKLMGSNKDITILQLADRLKVSDKTIKRDIEKLKNENKVARVGSLKAGHWEIHLPQSTQK